MKQKHWITVAAIVVFFGSCGQSLYTLANEQIEKKEDSAPQAEYGADPACTQDHDDKWEPRIRIRKPGFPCLDSAKYRPIVDVTNDPEVLGYYGPPAPGTKRIANFKHDDKFWIAEMDPNAIRSMAFQLAWFRAPANFPAAHAQMLVEFAQSSAVTLLKQKFPKTGSSPSQQKKSLMKVKNIILSATGAGEEGQSCNLIKGQQGQFAISYGVGSAQQRYQETKYSDPVTTVDSFPLLSPASAPMIDFLNNYLAASESNFRNLEAQVNPSDYAMIRSETERKAAVEQARLQIYEKATYRTLGRNCVTALVDLSKESGLIAPKVQGPVAQSLAKLSFYPPAAAFYLQTATILNLKERIRLDLDAEIERNNTLFVPWHSAMPSPSPSPSPSE
jgi:hypothetical protein